VSMSRVGWRLPRRQRLVHPTVLGGGFVCRCRTSARIGGGRGVRGELLFDIRSPARV